jgi:phosphomannomutase
VVLELMSAAARPLSELLRPYRRYADSGEINTEVRDPAAAVEAVAAAERARGSEIDRLDGLTVEHPDWWYNLRPSNTEPLLRLNVEAADEASCARHVTEVLRLVRAGAD